MKTVVRQDGTEVELLDAVAEKWVEKGLATYPQPKPDMNKKAQEPVKNKRGE